MEHVVELSTLMKKYGRRGGLRRVAITIAAPLALLIYFLPLEHYGLSFLHLDDDEQVIEAAP
jgi:hypothetical protein